MRTISFMLLLLLLTSFHAAPKKWQANTFPRTLIFAQSQLKYPLDASDIEYYGRWNDWPLLISKAPEETKEKNNHKVTKYDFFRIVKVMREYGLDGLGYWSCLTGKGSRPDFLKYMKDSEIKDFFITPYIHQTLFLPERDGRHIMDNLSVLPEYDGKKIIWSYGLKTSQDFAVYSNEMRKLYGDHFRFIYLKSLDSEYRQRFYRQNGLSAADRKALQDEVREALRLHDGFGWGAASTNSVPRDGVKIFATEFTEAMMEATREVFNEAEFKGKIFAAQALVGHENYSKLGYTMSSNGTKTLRDSLEIALRSGCDIIAIPEWDEQNENTSLRPTVFNGLSQMRIMRYYTGRLKGTRDYFLPGDDRALPNLVLSSRKIIALGEKLEFELLNVPDSVDQSGKYRVGLTLKNIDGKVLHTFPEHEFNANEIAEYRPSIASEKFMSERVILPELTIRNGAQTRIYANGLWAVQIQATWNHDYKWVKQGIRDLIVEPRVEFTLSPDTRAVGRISAPEKLSFAEVLDCGECIYSAGRNNLEYREDDDFYAVRIMWKSIIRQKINGKIKIKNAHFEILSGKTLTIGIANLYHHGNYVRIPRKEADRAIFKVEIPGQIDTSVSLKDILQNQAVVLSGKQGFNLSFHRQLRQFRHPENLDAAQSSFSARFSPDMPVSVMQLQLIAASGRVWRSRPLLTAPLSAERTETVVYSDIEARPVKVNVPANLVPDLQYEFTEKAGIVLPSGNDRLLYGIRGGLTDLAAFRGSGGESSTKGIPVDENMVARLWKGVDQLTPAVVESDGRTALRFTGSEYAGFPIGTIPRRAGFRISCSIKPDDVKSKQVLLACRRNYPGSLHEVYIENGNLHAVYINDQQQSFKYHSQTPLQAGAWNDIVIIYDQETLNMHVNGIKGQPLKAPGPGLYDMPLTMGNWGKTSFRGLLANLRIRHSPFEPKP